jgi:steroid delta-isomerase-like uncharacterized protein
MSTETNKALARRIYEELFRRGNADFLDEALAPGYVLHAAGMPGPAGAEAAKQGTIQMRAAFPDFDHTIEDLVAEGDHVVARWTARGTHRGTFNGIPATGKPVTISCITFLRLADGKVVEEWVQMDALGLLQQLGVIPAAGPAVATSPAAPRPTDPADPNPSPEANKAVLRRVVEEVVNGGNLAPVDALYSPNYVQRTFGMDLEAEKATLAMQRTAFPDGRLTVHEMVAEGDKVAWRGTMTGTHRGEMMGIPATGKSVAFAIHSVTRFAAGRIAENWAHSDQLGLMQQMGLLPASSG